MVKGKKLCVTGPDGKKWTVDRIQYVFDSDSKSGLVLGIVKDKEPVLLANIIEVEDRAALRAIFTGSYDIDEIGDVEGCTTTTRKPRREAVAYKTYTIKPSVDVLSGIETWKIFDENGNHVSPRRGIMQESDFKTVDDAKAYIDKLPVPE